MVNLTPRAIAELKRLKNQKDSSTNYLRVKVNQGGCLEYFYQLDFTEKSQEEDLEFTHDSGIAIITDPQSYEQVKNLTIDYLEDLMGGAFQFKNPNIAKHCNCGLSFALES